MIRPSGWRSRADMPRRRSGFGAGSSPRQSLSSVLHGSRALNARRCRGFQEMLTAFDVAHRSMDLAGNRGQYR